MHRRQDGRTYKLRRAVAGSNPICKLPQGHWRTVTELVLMGFSPVCVCVRARENACSLPSLVGSGLSLGLICIAEALGYGVTWPSDAL